MKFIFKHDGRKVSLFETEPKMPKSLNFDYYFEHSISGKRQRSHIEIESVDFSHFVTLISATKNGQVDVNSRVKNRVRFIMKGMFVVKILSTFVKKEVGGGRGVAEERYQRAGRVEKPCFLPGRVRISWQTFLLCILTSKCMLALMFAWSKTIENTRK